MVDISIVCLIYKSEKLAEAVYESLHKYTPMLRNGRAELLFVANDPTEELVDFLEKNKYPFIINVNDKLDEQTLFKQGFGAPEYMRRVYQGYNQGILNAKGQKIVLINSDNFFSEDWLENLLKYSDYKKVVCSTLVEPGNDDHGVFPFALQKDFGRTVGSFKEREFQEYASKICLTGYTSGGAYMPCLLYRDVAVLAGLYPEGNIAGKSFSEVKRYGDEAFYDRLKRFGVEHITAKDSIVYHLKEGESSSKDKLSRIIDDKKYKRTGLSQDYLVKSVEHIPYIIPEPNHQDVMNQLGNKLSVFIVNFYNHEDLTSQINQVANLGADHLDVTVLYDKTNQVAIGNKVEGINYVFGTKSSQDTALYDLIHKAYGEYIVVMSKDCRYEGSPFKQVNNKAKIYYLGNKEPVESVIIDRIGQFIIPKRVVLGNLGFFLGLFVSESDVEIKRKQCLAVRLQHMSQHSPSIKSASGLKHVLKHTLVYRAARKLYRHGPVKFTKTAVSKIRSRLGA